MGNPCLTNVRMTNLSFADQSVGVDFSHPEPQEMDKRLTAAPGHQRGITIFPVVFFGVIRGAPST
jgi:hypothetical protein